MERLNDYQKAQKWLEGYDWDGDPEADDNLATICEALQGMEKYEDLEEQGKLLKLPCAVGGTVYEVQKIRKRVQPYEIRSINIGRGGELFYYWELKDGHGIYSNLAGFCDRRLGVDIILTKEEAEAALIESKT